jgi:hypothetical protein
MECEDSEDESPSVPPCLRALSGRRTPHENSAVRHTVRGLSAHRASVPTSPGGRCFQARTLGGHPPRTVSTFVGSPYGFVTRGVEEYGLPWTTSPPPNVEPLADPTGYGSCLQRGRWLCPALPGRARDPRARDVDPLSHRAGAPRDLPPVRRGGRSDRAPGVHEAGDRGLPSVWNLGESPSAVDGLSG